MTLNRDVSATQIPARLARPPRERRWRPPQALVLLAFQKLSTNKDFGSLSWLLSQACPRFINLAFFSQGKFTEEFVAKRKMVLNPKSYILNFKTETPNLEP